MAQVETTFFHAPTDAAVERLSDACFKSVGQCIYHRDPLPKDVSVISNPSGIGRRSPYWVEIEITLDSDDWLRGWRRQLLRGRKGRKAYNRIAQRILDGVTSSVPNICEFFVWIHGSVDGFAEGTGTYRSVTGPAPSDP